MFPINLEIRYFSYGNCVAITLRFDSSFSCMLLTSYLRYKCFCYSKVFFIVLVLGFFCGMIALRMEITLQLSFIFVLHSDVFSILPKLCYLFGWCSYAFWWRWNYNIFLYARIRYGNYTIKWSCFSYVYS